MGTVLGYLCFAMYMKYVVEPLYGLLITVTVTVSTHIPWREVDGDRDVERELTYH